MAIKGKVVSSKLRRPKVSIVQMAGNANTKFTAPNPNEANNVCVDEKLASAKISDYRRSSCQIITESRKKDSIPSSMRSHSHHSYIIISCLFILKFTNVSQLLPDKQLSTQETRGIYDMSRTWTWQWRRQAPLGGFGEPWIARKTYYFSSPYLSLLQSIHAYLYHDRNRRSMRRVICNLQYKSLAAWSGCIRSFESDSKALRWRPLERYQRGDSGQKNTWTTMNNAGTPAYYDKSSAEYQSQ